MIEHDLVNEKTLASTVRYDTHTRLWMQYVLASPLVRAAMMASPASAAACDRYRRICLIGTFTLVTAIVNVLPLFLVRNIPTIALALLALLLLALIEKHRMQLLAGLSATFITTLFKDPPPKGTLFQFGEEVARRYKTASFVDMTGRLDHILKRVVLAGYVLIAFILFKTGWRSWAILAVFTMTWPLALRSPRLLRALLRLP